MSSDLKITFRLRGPLAERLAQAASEQGVSVGLAAKGLLQDALQQVWASEIAHALGLLTTDVAALRAALTCAVETLLLNVAHAEPEEVRRFLAQRMSTSRGGGAC